MISNDDTINLFFKILWFYLNIIFLIEYMELTAFHAPPLNEEDSEEPIVNLPLEVFEDPMDP